MCYTLKNLVNKLGYVLHEFQQEAAVTLADIVQELGECVDKVSRWTFVRKHCVALKPKAKTLEAPA